MKSPEKVGGLLLPTSGRKHTPFIALLVTLVPRYTALLIAATEHRLFQGTENLSSPGCSRIGTTTDVIVLRLLTGLLP